MAELQEVAVGVGLEMLDEAADGGAVVGVGEVLAGGVAGPMEGVGAEGGEFAGAGARRKTAFIDAAQAARLLALLGDASLPITERDSIQEAIMNGQLAASPMEQETVADRIRREAREAGRKEGERDGRIAGERDGRVAGIREAMLELVKELAPDRIREFEAIADLHVLRRAALALVRQ